MIPLRITAHLRGPVMISGGGLSLDGLVAWSDAQRRGLPPLLDGDDVIDIPIPIAKEPGGRFHLATFALARPEIRDNRWVNRRFPVEEAQWIGDAKLRRLSISAGPAKSYRIPRETVHFRGDRLYWWCVGEPDPIRDLLGDVFYVGKKRSVGCGAVERWEVEPCRLPWEGFPLTWRGRALRPLPLDWFGLVDPEPGIMPLTHPYWMHSRAETLAMPAMRY